jgi:hypothetical protein
VNNNFETPFPQIIWCNYVKNLLLMRLNAIQVFILLSYILLINVVCFCQFVNDYILENVSRIIGRPRLPVSETRIQGTANTASQVYKESLDCSVNIAIKLMLFLKPPYATMFLCSILLCTTYYMFRPRSVAIFR